MKRLPLFALAWLCAASVYAQRLQGGEPGADGQAVRQQRRVEIRTALQAKREVDTPSTQVVETVPRGRHLSPRERAEMRQQLRQQQPGNQNYRP